ncbi:MAG: hypothetical protein HYR49_03395 [Gammaproteobacteria bacterium]|nr:hypothetical protein [Gammaproteobacteria bacterium]
MKATVAVILLTLAAGQANAEGFYQMVVGNAPQAVQLSTGQSHGTNHSPLYEQVTSQSRAIANGESRTFTLAASSDATPLYRQVSGS